DDEDDQSAPLLGVGTGGRNREGPARLAKAAKYLGSEVTVGGGGKAGDRVTSILRVLYGRFPQRDIARTAWLSLMLFSIIGGFWLLDSMKDTVFERVVGLELQPTAKLLSVLMTLLLVIQYNRLIDTCNKPTLFYILGTVYVLIFVSIALVLRNARLGMENHEPSPFRLVGWVSYIAIETYGSLAVALFWAFTNATVNLEGAKATYGLIIAGAQIGAILGSTMATLVATSPNLHVWHLYLAGGVSPAVVALLVWGYVTMFPDHLPGESMHREAGAMDSALHGLKLVLKYEYVGLLFGISCLYEVVLTILDYQMKAREQGGGRGCFRETSAEEADEEMTILMGHFGQATNSLSLMMSLFGTSLAVRYLGLRRVLRIFPSLLLLAVVTSFFKPNLAVLFVAVSGLTYALNEPCKEMLYIPTSNAIKFKAKGWIDVFGSRCAKGVGSFITLSSHGNKDALATYGGLASFMISLMLLGVSFVMGKHFDTLMESGEIVGAEEDESPLPVIQK
ncbi:unnamed protein product, partial [Discosporangium mesarthrocarpum]